MKLRELYEILKKLEIYENSMSNLDNELVVELDNNSIGPTACTRVKSVGQGIDWDKGKFFLRTEDPIVFRTENEHLWQMALDFIYILAKETRSYKGVEKETDLARRAKKILDAAGIKY